MQLFFARISPSYWKTTICSLNISISVSMENKYIYMQWFILMVLMICDKICYMSLYTLYYILNQREWAIKLWQWRILCWLLFSYHKGNKIITVKLHYALGNNWECLWSSAFDKTVCPMEQDYKILQKRLPFLDELFGISEEKLKLGIWMFSTLGQVFLWKKAKSSFYARSVLYNTQNCIW